MLYQQKNSVGAEFFEHILYEDFFFPVHMHRHPELIHVRKGQLTIQWGGRTELAREGDFALLLPNTVHAYESTAASLVDVCIFSMDLVPSFFRQTRGKQAESTVFSCRNVVAELFREVVREGAGQPDAFSLKGLLYSVCGEYLNAIPLSDVGRKHEELADRLIQYVADNYLEDISLSSAAKELGYEEHYLSRCFHKLVPMHFSQYVNLYRVTEANSLLQHTDLSVSEIALRSGFQSLRSFNRVYLELTGRRPRSDRNIQE